MYTRHSHSLISGGRFTHVQAAAADLAVMQTYTYHSTFVVDAYHRCSVSCPRATADKVYLRSYAPVFTCKVISLFIASKKLQIIATV